MAGFNVGANAFLSSEFKVAQFAPNPVTERGSATVINVHPKEPKIIYCSGKFVVVKSLSSPKTPSHYRLHTIWVRIISLRDGWRICSPCPH